MALTSTEILLLVMDIVLAITVVYLLLKLRSTKKIGLEKEKRQADTAALSQKTEQGISETTSELIAPEKTTVEKPLNPSLELRVEALKKDKLGLEEKQVEVTPASSDAGEKAAPKNDGAVEDLSEKPGQGEGQDKVQEELEIEDKQPEQSLITLKDAEPKISNQGNDTLMLEDDLPGEPSSLSTDSEPGTVEPEKASKTRKRSSKKKRTAKKEPGTVAEGSATEEVKPVTRKRADKKKKPATEEGQAAGDEAAKDVPREEKTGEEIPESKPLF